MYESVGMDLIVMQGAFLIATAIAQFLHDGHDLVDETFAHRLFVIKQAAVAHTTISGSLLSTYLKVVEHVVAIFNLYLCTVEHAVLIKKCGACHCRRVDAHIGRSALILHRRQCIISIHTTCTAPKLLHMTMIVDAYFQLSCA